MPVRPSAQQMVTSTLQLPEAGSRAGVIRHIQKTTCYCSIYSSVRNQQLMMTHAHPGFLAKQLQQHDYAFLGNS